MEEAQKNMLTTECASAIPLSRVQAGQTVGVVRVLGGMGVHSRLTGIGIASGVSVEVIRNESRSPVLLGVRHARIAIGRGMAEKVLVRICGTSKEGVAG
jgi:Fe2+ transport system protein FeoA